MLSVELRNLRAKVIHAHRLRMGSSTIVRYFASQEFRVTPVREILPLSIEFSATGPARLSV